MKNLARFKYSVNIDVDIMREDMNMTDEQIKAWFNTPCDDETARNCLYNIRCMRDIAAEMVMKNVEKLLTNRM